MGICGSKFPTSKNRNRIIDVPFKMTPELREILHLCKIHSVSNEEIKILSEIFLDLLKRSEIYGEIGKEVFLQFFALPVGYIQGLWGEKLFAKFDTCGAGKLDFEEFMKGLSICCKGSEEDKFRFLFSMYDLREDGYIDKVELVSMLHNFSETVSTLTSISQSSRHASKDTDQSDLFIHLKSSTNLARSSRAGSRYDTQSTHRSTEVQNIASQIIEQFGLGEDGKLSFDEFKTFLQNYPELMNKFSGSFQQEVWSPKESQRKQSKPKINIFKRNKDESALIHPTDIEMQGFVYRTVKDSEKLQKLFAVLKSSLLMLFENKGDKLPYGVVLLDGVYVDRLQEYYDFKYGFCLSHANESYDHVYIWCDDLTVYSNWISKLEQAAHIKKFKHYYHLEKKIGQGKFSDVYLASEINSGHQYAVKVIEKSKLSKSEKELIRSEVAIMRILNHPGVISMKEIFDTRKHILIIMEYVKGGELFNLIRSKEVFSEYFTNKIIEQLLATTSYIHEVGIVHRDIKPENILCVDDSDLPEIKLADFGLSKLVSPNDVLKLACGTLSYVAPEVLKKIGYNKKADIWSIGVITYLLLRGRLPFEHIDKNTVIELTVNTTPDFSNEWCSRYTSEAIDFVKLVLNKDPNLRPTAEEALQHPWIKNADIIIPRIITLPKTDQSPIKGSTSVNILSKYYLENTDFQCDNTDKQIPSSKYSLPNISKHIS